MKQHQFVEDLISKMTVDEKVQQLSCIMPLMVSYGEDVQEEKMKKMIPNGVGHMTQFSGVYMSGARSIARAANAIQKYHVENTRLGIPVMIQNESAAGLVAADATIFPVPIAMASTWQPGLVEGVGKTIQEQARAVGIVKCLSPVADVARDARWGRVGETFGEDPTLVSAMSVAEAKGLQGNNYGDQVISCAKHFMGYGASDNGYNCAEINIGRKELREVYGTPFAAMIKETDLQAVMVTYSEIDGQPMSINKEYMQNFLRKDLGFTGSAICDGGSIERVYNTNGVGRSKEAIAIKAAKVGIDADTPMTDFYYLLADAIKEGRCEEKVVDDILRRVLNQKYELGLFDNPYVDEDKAVEIFNKPEGNILSKEISEKSIVLMKNKDSILPLKDSYKKIGLIGPFANRVSTLFGGYAYPSMSEMYFSACYDLSGNMEGGFGNFFRELMDVEKMHELFGIQDNLSYTENFENYIKNRFGFEPLLKKMKEIFKESTISHAVGWTTIDEYEKNLQEAIEVAKNQDVLILCLGEVTGFGAGSDSGEGVNNPNLKLPGKQAQLIKELRKLGKPMILVLFNGRPLELTDIDDDVDAILDVWYPGPFGPEAISKVLHGDINPSGKLPVTFPRLSSQCPMFYGHKIGSGYRGIQEEGSFNRTNGPLYHFGHGLSYTSFEYSNLNVSKEVDVDGEVEISLTIKNIGNVKGADIPQIYFRTVNPTINRPILELRAFNRVELEPNEQKTIQFTVPVHALGYYNEDDEYVIEPADVKVFAGASSNDIKLESAFEIVGNTKEIMHEREYLFTVK